MKKIILLSIFIVSLFLIVGCGNGSGGGFGFGDRGSGDSSSSYFGGKTEGLVINFINLQPRDTIREGEEFTIGLDLINNGQCDVIGEICVRDALSDVFGGVEDSCQEIELKAIENINGNIRKDSRKLFFRGNGYEDIQRELTTQIIAKATYGCEFISGPQLCVKPVVGEDEDICKSVEDISGKNLKARNAPVTITKVHKEVFTELDGVRLLATITLGKMSKGNLFSEDSSENRGNSLFMRAVYEGFGEMECDELEGNLLYWRADETSKIVQCSLEIGEIDLLANPLDIELSYDYEISENKQITIKERFDSDRRF
ncbi:hypothetical protein CL617_00160 [archaeon]|nr:hypothetical protein [archaeon]|tara:strand:- start:5941 stop:6882 length:942 start_codon:yes stop_codon:yes gene_type:complete